VSWFFLALAGTACMATTAVLDKFILSRYSQTSSAYLASLVLAQQIFAILIFAYAGIDPRYPESLFALVAGIIQMGLWLAYLKAMQLEEVSRVAAMSFVYPIFVFIGASVFLRESLTFENYLGGLLLAASAVLLSYRRSDARGRLMLSPALKYMAVFWVFVAMYAIWVKYTLSLMDQWHLYAWSSVGSLLVVPLMMTREGIWSQSLGIFKKGLPVVSAILLEEVFDFMGRLFQIFAYSEGPASLVASVGSLQPVMVLTMIAALSLLTPGALKEEIRGGALASKVAGMLLVAAGIYLIS
jgi:uncharacterized membrane protein